MKGFTILAEDEAFIHDTKSERKYCPCGEQVQLSNVDIHSFFS